MERTALMFAAGYNRVEAIEALLAAGADVRVANKVVDLAELTDPLESAARRARPGCGAWQRRVLRRSAARAGAGPGASRAAPAGAGLDRPYIFNELVGSRAA